MSSGRYISAIITRPTARLTSHLRFRSSISRCRSTSSSSVAAPAESAAPARGGRSAAAPRRPCSRPSRRPRASCRSWSAAGSKTTCAFSVARLTLASDALHLVERLLDAPHARGAGHALDRQGHVAGFRRGSRRGGGGASCGSSRDAVARLLDGCLQLSTAERRPGRKPTVAFSVARLTLAS